MAEAPEVAPLTSAAEIESTPRGVVQRWLAELALADKAEADWRKDARDLWKLYEGGRKKNHSFNIFWSNTETLAPSLYNSTPQCDVRRRFRDADPLGRAVSATIQRALSYENDAYDFDAHASAFVLDMLVTGRGVVRIVYEPRFVEGEAGPQAANPGDEPAPEVAPTAERVAERNVRCESVQWDDFRRGPGRTWAEVPWIAFRHDFTQQMALEKFGEQIARRLKYTEGRDSESLGRDTDPPVRELFKTCEVWEFWDRDTRQVHFIAPTFKDAPLLTADDPLRLRDFYPVPRPAYAITDTRSLVPIPLYKLYEEQAKELDRISARINKIVDACRVRGAYSANLTEVANILEADDNQMIPVSNVSEIASVGGLDNAIWTMPIDKLKAVLEQLYVAREQTKQAIYEITGLSDIIRGSTNAQETAAAQKLKSQWGSLRLQRLQREVARVIRDLFRLQAEVIAEQYPLDTLAQVTNLPYPTAQQQAQAQQMAQMAQAAGQPVPPELEGALTAPTWEQIGEVMRSDKLREYRIDVESDSTVQETIDRDMSGLQEVIGNVGQVLAGVQQGLPVEVAKEVALAVVRRARLGHAVEDALEKLDGAAAEGAANQIAEQVMQVVESKSAEGAKAMRQREKEAALQQQAEQQAAAIQQQQAEMQQQQQAAIMQQYEARANMALDQVMAAQQQNAQLLAAFTQSVSEAIVQMGATVAQAVAGVGEAVAQSNAGNQAVLEAVSRPKTVTLTRGPDGRVNGASSTIQ